jgi:hypothetical protein
VSRKARGDSATTIFLVEENIDVSMFLCPGLRQSCLQFPQRRASFVSYLPSHPAVQLSLEMIPRFRRRCARGLKVVFV